VPKVLVIDDDEQFRYYLVTLLERAGYDVFSLQDGSRAQALLVAEAVDAIVTDLYMPHTDGIEIVGIVKRHAPAVPVIGISGGGLRPEDPCLKAMKALGATVVLTKPLDMATFLRTLREALAGSAKPNSSGVTTVPG